MAKKKPLTLPQKNMLADTAQTGFVLAPAGKPTAWILEGRGLLERKQMWTKTRYQAPGHVYETYVYELHITEKGKKVLAGLRAEQEEKKGVSHGR